MTISPGIPLPPAAVRPGLPVSRVPSDQGGLSDGPSGWSKDEHPSITATCKVQSVRNPTGVEFQVLNTWLAGSWPIRIHAGHTQANQNRAMQTWYPHTGSCGLGPKVVRGFPPAQALSHLYEAAWVCLTSQRNLILRPELSAPCLSPSPSLPIALSSLFSHTLENADLYEGLLLEGLTLVGVLGPPLSPAFLDQSPFSFHLFSFQTNSQSLFSPDPGSGSLLEKEPCVFQLQVSKDSIT